jgi:cytochrome c oxidase subunit 3
MSAPALQPFDDLAQKDRADRLGMFIFLASEVMLFGGLFAALSAYRAEHPQAAAEAAQHLNIWLGGANTAVLLTSSLFAALAGLAAKRGQGRRSAVCLWLTAALGVVFLVIKGSEYRLEYLDGVMPGVGPPSPLGDSPATLFISLYFVSTALHALHLTIGVAMTAVAGVGAVSGRLPMPARARTVELIGLYWHLVDVIWIFLFPLLYLARP